MNKIRQHVPGFVSGVDPEEAEFRNLHDLIEISFVKRFVTQKGFIGFSYAYDISGLVAHYSDGTRTSHWVVGFLREMIDGIPRFPHTLPISNVEARPDSLRDIVHLRVESVECPECHSTVTRVMNKTMLYCLWCGEWSDPLKSPSVIRAREAYASEAAGRS